MARPRKLTTELADLDACTWAMAELLGATTDVEALVAERDLAVAKAQVDFEPLIDHRRKHAADMHAALEAYYYAHVTEIESDGAKHLQLANGRIGRRDNPPRLEPLNRKWSWKLICDAVKARWPGKYLHAPKPPDLDRDAIKALGTEELKQVGLKLTQDETFYAEPARPPKGVS